MPAPIRFLVFAVILASIAAAAGSPSSSDRDVYERIGRHIVALDCSDVHCFRPLVAVIVEHLPGPSLFKWKAYAVVVIAASALATLRLVRAIGLPVRAAALASWLAAFGYGPLQSVFDPYTSDPVMYLLGPWMLAELLANHRIRATVAGCVGVLAKEFAAVPLWIYALYAFLARRWHEGVRVLLGAVTATLVWLILQTALMTLFNYSYGVNPSVNLLGGGYLAVWARALGYPTAAFYLFMAFGPLYVLFAAGLGRASLEIRLLAVATVPALAAFVYVQQPDRALWNFHFIVIPVAVSVLTTLPDRLCWMFVACFAVSNLRLAPPQPAGFTAVRVVTITASMVLSIVAASRAAAAPAEAAVQ